MDRRELTGARSLQTAWSAVALLSFLLVAAVRPALVRPVPLAVGTAAWLGGLGVLGLRDRRAWTRLAAASTFEPGAGGGYADLHRALKGRSVIVSADVPSLLSQTETVVSTSVDREASDGPVELARVGEGASGDGVDVANPALDGAWVIDGQPDAVDRLLSADVQAALMDVTVPVTITVRAGRVSARVPFTRLEPAELGAIATAVATLAERAERLEPAARSR